MKKHQNSKKITLVELIKSAHDNRDKVIKPVGARFVRERSMSIEKPKKKRVVAKSMVDQKDNNGCNQKDTKLNSIDLVKDLAESSKIKDNGNILEGDQKNQDSNESSDPIRMEGLIPIEIDDVGITVEKESTRTIKISQWAMHQALNNLSIKRAGLEEEGSSKKRKPDNLNIGDESGFKIGISENRKNPVK